MLAPGKNIRLNKSVVYHRYESHVLMQKWGAKHITSQSKGVQHGFICVFQCILYSTCFSTCFDLIALEKFIYIYIMGCMLIQGINVVVRVHFWINKFVLFARFSKRIGLVCV